jgi:hypothetical protein
MFNCHGNHVSSTNQYEMFIYGVGHVDEPSDFGFFIFTLFCITEEDFMKIVTGDTRVNDRILGSDHFDVDDEVGGFAAIMMNNSLVTCYIPVCEREKKSIWECIRPCLLNL